MRGHGRYKNRVTICRARDKVVDQDIFVARDNVFSANAYIVAVRGSFFQDGYAVGESRVLYSHNIFIRVAPRFDVTGSAWIFEHRAITGARWYKILNTQDTCENGLEWRFLCRLVEKSDDIDEPTDSRVVKLPEGIRL